MEEVSVNGETFVGEDTSELVLKLWTSSHRLSMAQIGRLLGVTRQRVYAILNNKDLGGYHEYPELELETTFAGRTDEEVAGLLGVPKSRVTSARLELGRRHNKPAGLDERRLMLCCHLFGEAFLPGDEFTDYIREMAKKHLTPVQSESLEFYLAGDKDIIDTSNNRVTRYYARTRLSEFLPAFSELVEKEVLTYA